MIWGLSYFLSRKQGWLVDFCPESKPPNLEPWSGSSLVPSVADRGLFLKMSWGEICDLGKLTAKAPENWCLEYNLPSRELTYPTWGKGKSSSKVPWKRDMLVPWRVPLRLLKFPLLRCYDVCFREGFSHIPWVPWPPSQDAMPVISMKVSVAGFP